ncbi:MAG TPA: hypothetical protein VMN99_01935 [Anaerolineales bacterium]|nr:hypothetical protein [Anaerolineales bacterium]
MPETCKLRIFLCQASQGKSAVGEIRQFSKLPEDGQSLMRAAMSQLNLSARAYHRILKLARTIADLSIYYLISSSFFFSAATFFALPASRNARADAVKYAWVSRNLN